MLEMLSAADLAAPSVRSTAVEIAPTVSDTTRWMVKDPDTDSARDSIASATLRIR